jgi:predicted HTH domain antitoxin
MESQALVEFNEILEPLGTQSAQFFLAASLYHAKKVSFNRAAELAGLSFEDFLARLKEHFSTGYVLTEEAVMEDINTADKLISDS